MRDLSEEKTRRSAVDIDLNFPKNKVIIAVQREEGRLTQNGLINLSANTKNTI